ncbi:hypothetical protein [Flavobacterium sp.]|uniref:hypothetical protein n=1 Tax=Flavobacterium sp. TaxID=239 RepID=UPI0012012452|nr:hypothetical protein [Flavobacterium sp.]RZJ69616.1 MAG: hypothetical protein EOO49_16835 [Flavobacterium sp.]
MENTHEDWKEPINDGQNQGHDWERHTKPEETSKMMKSDDPEDDEKEDDEETESADWGDVDPQHDPLVPPGPMDPSGPGSAV